MSQAQPTMLSDVVKAEIDHWVAKFPAESKRSALLMALRAQQKACRWLSDESIDAVADYLGCPRIHAYEVVSFYSLYHRQPVGKYVIRVCGSISCHLVGAHDTIHHLEELLGIRLGETTADGLFTLMETECLAACTRAPVLTINDDRYHADLTKEKVAALIDDLRAKEAAL